MTEIIEIYFSDLTPEAQSYMLKNLRPLKEMKIGMMVPLAMH